MNAPLDPVSLELYLEGVDARVISTELLRRAIQKHALKIDALGAQLELMQAKQRSRRAEYARQLLPKEAK